MKGDREIFICSAKLKMHYALLLPALIVIACRTPVRLRCLPA
jgi:hypothetical protein